MSTIISEVTNYTPAPAGLHPAVCIAVVDLGLQQTPFGVKPQILLQFELADASMDDGRPFTLSRKFTAGLNKRGNLPAIPALMHRRQ